MGKSKYFLLDCQLFTGDLIEIARNPSLTETGIGFKGKIKVRDDGYMVGLVTDYQTNIKSIITGTCAENFGMAFVRLSLQESAEPYLSYVGHINEDRVGYIGKSSALSPSGYRTMEYFNVFLDAVKLNSNEQFEFDKEIENAERVVTLSGPFAHGLYVDNGINANHRAKVDSLKVGAKIEDETRKRVNAKI